MLIVGIDLHLKGQGPSIHFDADDFGAQAKRWGELHPAVAGARPLGLEHNAARSFAIFKVCIDRTDVNVVNSERRPIRGDMRSESDLMALRIGLQSKKST